MITTLLACLILGAVFGLTLWAGFAMVDEVLKTGEPVGRAELARELLRTGAMCKAPESRWLAGNSVWPLPLPAGRWCSYRARELPPNATCTCGPLSQTPHTGDLHATFYGKPHTGGEA